MIRRLCARRRPEFQKASCAEYHCQLIVNDHWRLAIEEGRYFVHLGQEDLQTVNLLAIRADGLRETDNFSGSNTGC
ncbi:thiamine phosphate synthase (plasmid) [Mesorhizobium sp. AR07]|nr:thiamine phosphate synthase [Mesorhizobium sp. AR07]